MAGQTVGGTTMTDLIPIFSSRAEGILFAVLAALPVALAILDCLGVM